MFGRNNDKAKVRFKLLSEHDGGEIPDYHGWYLPGSIVYSDDPPESWMVLECDNPTCSGLAHLSLDDIRAVPLGVVLPDPPGTAERYKEMRGV